MELTPLLLQIKAQITRLRTKLGQIAGNVPVADAEYAQSQMNRIIQVETKCIKV